MKTAAIIPNWQGRGLLQKNLPSVLKVGFDEVIVVDDGSTDGSVQFLKDHFPSVNIVRHKKNKGFSRAVNNGVSKTNADIIFLLNTDVIPSPNILKPVLKHFTSREVFGVSLGEKGYSYAVPEIKNGYLGHKPGPKANIPHNTFWISGGSGAFRKSMWDTLGGLDTLFSPFYWEDVDLSFRALKRGWKLIWEPNAQVLHKHESTINTENFTKRYMDYIKERNQLLFHWKNLEADWLIKKHVPGILRRLRSPGYSIVVLLALAKLPEVIWSRRKKGDTLSDAQVLRQFTGGIKGP